MYRPMAFVLSCNVSYNTAATTHMEGRDRVEGDVQGDQFGPRVNERGQLLDSIVTHVDSLKALQQIDWLRDCKNEEESDSTYMYLG